ncbi:hypothetical protein SD15574_0172 [Shigella dysenteriae 155-74]|nr:hypothetical protein Sd1012_3522 [Shigella dysenteriae 1012]EGJ03040.1 hypothetical protein SD15574_0172 [Shigella dysenteriae 155-74]
MPEHPAIKKAANHAAFYVCNLPFQSSCSTFRETFAYC